MHLPISTNRASYCGQAFSKPSAHRVNKTLLAAAVEASSQAFYDARIAAWLNDTQYSSSTSVMTAHPKFGELLDMGDAAIKFTLARIKEGDVKLHWFPLLKRASNEDPVPPEDRGYADRMAAHWLQWGRGRGKT